MSSKIFPIPSYQPATRAEWRTWLATNHATSQGIQLVIIRKKAGVTGINYDEAVEEALCFGWIDGGANSVDAQHFKLYMSPRKPGGVWSKLNKQRIRKLIKDGSMTPVGLAKIQAAKKDGSWTRMDAIDKLDMPEDLLEQLSANPEAKHNFEAFSPSAKKIILFWITKAKREETRRKRIEETIRLAAQNIKAAHRRQ